MLHIFNTFSKKKEKFISILPNMVNMYVCGVTVYNLCHIGHGRTFVVFDVIARYLKYLGYNLNYIRNITDIDDKIVNHAIKNQSDFKILSNQMLQEMYKDFDSLYIIRPNLEPRVTDYINDIIQYIQILINKQHAYITKKGNVMFSIKTYSKYGILSNQNIKNLIFGKRIKIDHAKHHPLDFVLWKKSQLNEPGWVSPWSFGRPGWHIECSTINYKTLGNIIDIHGGGSDLIFPHHENEIAQSTCAHNSTYIKYWIHSEMVTINNLKMSKSTNNFKTIRETINIVDSESVRYFLLSSHYRSILKYNKNNLIQSQNSLKRLYNTLLNTNIKIPPSAGKKFTKKFYEAMNDDFNTPEAYSVLFTLSNRINILKKIGMMNKANILASELRFLANILGLLSQTPEQFFKNTLIQNKEITIINNLIEERKKARQIKNWDYADKIRNNLKNNFGILLEDKYNDTIWKNK